MQAGLPPDPPSIEIVVTARALPDPAAERAYTVDRIGAQRLRTRAERSARPDAQGGAGPAAVPALRRAQRPSDQPGRDLRALGGNASSRALLILDGVPQADPFGGWVNWPAYDPASLAEVRVVRGGGSVANGPGALAGTIEMTSRLGHGSRGERRSRQPRVARRASVRRLSAGRRHRSVCPARASPRRRLRSGHRRHARPRRPRRAVPGSERPRSLGRAARRRRPSCRLSALGFPRQTRRGASTSPATAPMAPMRRSGWSAAGGWQWSALGYGQWRDLTSSFASVSPDRIDGHARVAAGFGSVARASAAASSCGRRSAADSSFASGGDVRLTDGESRELFTYVAGQPTRRRRRRRRDPDSGPVRRGGSQSSARLTLSAGGRVDRWRISRRPPGRAGPLPPAHSLRDEHYPIRSGWRPTARAGAVCNAGGGFSLRSAAYLGWRMPTLNELFRPFRAGPTRPPPTRSHAGAACRRRSRRAIQPQRCDPLGNGVRKPALRCDRERHPRPWSRHFSGRGLRCRRISPAAEPGSCAGARDRSLSRTSSRCIHSRTRRELCRCDGPSAGGSSQPRWASPGANAACCADRQPGVGKPRPCLIVRRASCRCPVRGRS